jgi:Asp-tRNA(Asn)/Glu-tRNA(Gln) amidotransferase A subunit family amidase
MKGIPGTRIYILLLIAAFSAGIAFAKPFLEITTESIRMAAELFGLDFNEAKREQMLGNLRGQQRSLQAVREYDLANSTPPAVLFQSLPQGYALPDGESKMDWDIPNAIDRPSSDADLAYMSLPELAGLIQSKKISSEELTRFFLQRLKNYGDTLEAVVTLTEERAIAQAKQADIEIAQGQYRGILHGIPYGVKDLFAVEGYKTTWGAMPYKDQQLDETATVVKKLDEAGAVLIAKLSLGALAMGDVWYGGVTKNPWRLDQGSSGSSAGSASAVAAGLVPFAIGTETLGSIVSPSTRCGVTGLRPTFGRVSRAGGMALSWSMDKVGPITRSAEDAAIVFAHIQGPDLLDLTLHEAPFSYGTALNPQQLRVGYIKSFFDQNYAGKEADQKVLDDLRTMGFVLEEVEWNFELPVNALRIILNAEAGAAFDQLTRSGKDSLLVAQGNNAWPNLFRSSRFIPAAEYINANRIRSILQKEVHALLEKYDVVLTPSYGGNQLLVTNLTGHPCVVVRNGFAANGTPLSISFLANLFEEEKALALAQAWQEYDGQHLDRPPLFNKP